MSLTVALVLASHTTLHHDMLDMATHYATRWDVSVELRVEPSGAATFHMTGNVESRATELTPAGARAVGSDATRRVDETWTGRATVSSSAIVVRFDHGRGTAVDVTWRCQERPTPVSSVVTPVWSCATTQSMTRPSGPGYPLPVYLQVPTYLAAAPVALRVDVTARGGADHRSSVTTSTLWR